jgi:DNA repair protein RadC
VAHNHPSGSLKPSQADINLTKELKDWGNFLHIPLLDHIILTSESYFSFANESSFL